MPLLRMRKSGAAQILDTVAIVMVPHMKQVALEAGDRMEAVVAGQVAPTSTTRQPARSISSPSPRQLGHPQSYSRPMLFTQPMLSRCPKTDTQRSTRGWSVGQMLPGLDGFMDGTGARELWIRSRVDRAAAGGGRRRPVVLVSSGTSPFPGPGVHTVDAYFCISSAESSVQCWSKHPNHLLC